MTAQILIRELRSAGVQLKAEGHRLRFYPQSKVTPEQLGRLKQNKAELLAILSGDSTVSPPQEPTYSLAERQVLADAGVAPGSMPLLDEVKATFPDAEVVSVEPEPVDNPRREAARLIRREAWRRDPERAVATRDAWRERMARCTIDGQLTEQDAEAVALDELNALTDAPV